MYFLRDFFLFENLLLHFLVKNPQKIQPTTIHWDERKREKNIYIYNNSIIFYTSRRLLRRIFWCVL